MRYVFFSLAVGVCWAAAVDREKAPEVEHRLPSLASVFPQGARPGQTVHVELLGQYLDRSSKAVFSEGKLTARLISVSPTRIEAEFTIPGDAAFDHYQFRVMNPRGASNPVLFRVGDLPHHGEREPNSTLETAETVPTSITIDGRLDKDDDFDFFRFRAEAGETLVFDLRAARNGNGLDAALVLLEANGRKVAHDEDTFIWDPFLAHKFERGGEYVAAVQPTHGRNDPTFAYQLDIRRSAHLQTVSPIALKPGSETEVTIFGEALLDPRAKLSFGAPGFSGDLLQARGQSATARIRVPQDATTGPHVFVVAGRDGRSNPATFLVDPDPRIVGTARYRQPERFPVAGKRGQSLLFEVRAMRFGSPVDSYVRLLDKSGKQIAANDDGSFPGTAFNKDSRLTYTFQQDGDYQIEIRNLYATSGENYPYQLVIREAKPVGVVQLSDDRPYLYRGQSRKFPVAVERIDGHDAEIPITVEGLPPGVSVKSARIAAKEKTGEIELAVSDDVPVGTSAELTIKGPDGTVAWQMAGVASGGGEGRTNVRVDRVYLVIAEKPKFSLECAFTSLNLVRGGTAELKVMVRRDTDLTGEIRFRADNLPAGVTIDKVEQTAEVATLRFRAAAHAELGRAARVSILGEAGGQLQAAPRISLLVD